MYVEQTLFDASRSCVDLSETNPTSGAIRYCKVEKQSDGSGSKICTTYLIKYVSDYSAQCGRYFLTVLDFVRTQVG
jgi:hypothetical protein